MVGNESGTVEEIDPLHRERLRLSRLGSIAMGICIMYSMWYIDEAEQHVDGQMSEKSQVKGKANH